MILNYIRENLPCKCNKMGEGGPLIFMNITGTSF